MIPPDQRRLEELLQVSRLKQYQKDLLLRLNQKYSDPKHGHFAVWCSQLESLPTISPSRVDIKQDAPVIGHQSDCSVEQINQIKNTLMAFRPWRKGPFELFGIYIDSEWRSDFKWTRIAPYINNLEHKVVLDIGCGNGYYALRMQALGAELVIGVDPSWLFVFQNLAIQKYTQSIQRTFVLPFMFEEFPKVLSGFDSIFSMGVLYHRKNPLIHLQSICDMLTDDGQFILETLAITDDSVKELIPAERYANMRNVWKIPNCMQLKNWLHKVGFNNIEVVDVTKTTINEQRKTEWMTGHSLQDALDPYNNELTIEGYPAPIRVCVIASK